MIREAIKKRKVETLYQPLMTSPLWTSYIELYTVGTAKLSQSVRERRRSVEGRVVVIGEEYDVNARPADAKYYEFLFIWLEGFCLFIIFFFNICSIIHYDIHVGVFTRVILGRRTPRFAAAMVAHLCDHKGPPG